MSRWARVLLLVSAALSTACGGAPHTHDGDAPELVGVWYTVKAGDSVSAIARDNGVPLEDIVELNGLVDPSRIEVGQDLFLYGIDELLARRVKAAAPASSGSGGSAAGPSTKPKAKPKPKPKAGGARPATGTTDGPKPKRSRFVWPMDSGRLTSGFGRRGRRMHKGIDIADKPGTPIKAAAAGEVIYSDNKQRGYGNLVIIQHRDDAVTVYAHNRRNLVDEGDTVRQGAVIAELGNTGRSTGPHLHFEIRLKGKAVDPLIHLPAR